MLTSLLAMTLYSGQATAMPPSADINRRLPISIATRPALNWDHYRCNAGKNIMPLSKGLARWVSYGRVAIRSLSVALRTSGEHPKSVAVDPIATNAAQQS
jgi:hypothetical protein